MKRYIEERLGYKPRTAVWELTLACNSRCRHCGTFAGRPRDDELDTAEAIDLVDQLARLGCERISLSGGEPLLRRDWHLVGEAIARRGMRVGMISNGLAFTREEAAKAAGFGVEGVSFSIDGLEESHQRMRSIPDSFGRVMKAVETAQRGGITVCAVTHVNRWNLRELHGMHRMLGEAGINTWKVQLSNPAGEMASSRDLVLGPADLLALMPALLDIRRRGRPFLEISDSIGYYGPYERPLRTTWRDEVPFWMGCTAGLRSIGIESNGNVKGCLALPSERHGCSRFVEGNVRRRSLADIWDDPAGFAYNRAFRVSDLEGFCRTCRYAEICRGGCRWTALSHGGTIAENRLCYHRAWTLARRETRGQGAWLPSCMAPAVLFAFLGLAGCENGSELTGGYDGRSDPVADVRAEADATGTDAAGERDAPPADAPSDATADPSVDVPGEEAAPTCPTTREGLCCFACNEVSAFKGDWATCEELKQDCAFAGEYGDPSPTPVLVPPECADPCCPTAAEVCCMCDYMGPPPVRPQCKDPCEPPNDSLYADQPPSPDDGGSGGGR